MITVMNNDTVRIQSSFYSFDNALTDPDVVKLKIYTSGQALVDEFILNESNKMTMGQYEYYYTVDRDRTGSTFFYEMYGELDGHPIVDREKVKVVFSVK